MKRSQSLMFVDSSVHGAKIYNKGGILLGETPLYIKVNPDRKKSLKFLENDEVREQGFRCKVNWQESVLPNLILAPLFPVGTILSGGFITLDFYSGRAYNCDQDLFIDNSKEKSKIIKKENILIFPIFVGDEKLSDKARSYISQKFENVIDLKSSKEEMLFKGIDHRNVDNIKSLRKYNHNLKELFFDLSITKFIFSKVVQKENAIYLEPRLYSAFSFEELECTQCETIKVTSNEIRETGFTKTLKSAINLLPNAFKLSGTAKPDVSFFAPSDSSTQIDLTGDYHPDSLPKVATLIGLESIDHPQFYRPWDFSFSFYPIFSGTAWKNSLRVQGIDYQVSIANFYALYNLGLVTHTPFGAFELDIGIGPNHSVIKDNFTNNASQTGIVSRVNLGYYAFLTDRYYFRLDFSNFNLNESPVKNTFYKMESWREVSFGIGAYLPELKSWIRDLL